MAIYSAIGRNTIADADNGQSTFVQKRKLEARKPML
jgi:hypothetical protein